MPQWICIGSTAKNVAAVGNWSFIQTNQNKAGVAGTVTNTSFSSQVGVGHIVCGYFFYTTSSTNVISSITDDQSNTYNVVNFNGSEGFGFGDFWGGPFSNQPQTIKITTSVSQSGGTWVGIDEFAPRAGTVSVDGNNSAGGSPATTSGNFTPSANFDLIYSATVAAGVSANGSGFTPIQTLGDFNSEYMVLATAGTTAGTWTISGNSVITAFALKSP